jgi:hypothetical protein
MLVKIVHRDRRRSYRRRRSYDRIRRLCSIAGVVDSNIRTIRETSLRATNPIASRDHRDRWRGIRSYRLPRKRFAGRACGCWSRRDNAVARFTKIAIIAAAMALAAAVPAQADQRTVCTITVNSPDEQAAMRRYLPERDYRFVDLVEHGRSDWLESACQRQVRCDILVVSGHFNGEVFYTTRFDVNDHLPVVEMERASCSASCPALFSQLKEVYLFGCNTLNPEAGLSAVADVERSLVHSGYSPRDANRLARDLGKLHGESNRDIMRRIFVNVPAIHGFSSTAPLGPTAGTLVDRYFRSGAKGDFGSGRTNGRLLATFAAQSMTAVPGQTSSDPRAGYRAEVCRFVDERRTPAQRLRFIGEVLGRGTADARMFLGRIESFLASLDDGQKEDGAFVAALDDIASDGASRERFLAIARDAELPTVRARMLGVARSLRWLSTEQHHAERVALIGDLLARAQMSAADVDLVCTLNGERAFDADRAALALASPSSRRIDRAAALACLGDSGDHLRMLAALSSANEADVRMAEVYFYHRPITDAGELRGVTAGVVAMTHADAQVRALDTLARLHVSDRDALIELVKLFPRAASVAVQRAIAGILIRADYRAIASSETVSVIREHRLRSPDAVDVIDILLRRMQASS